MNDNIKFVRQDIAQEALRLHQQIATNSQACATARREQNSANIEHHTLMTAHERLTGMLYMQEQGRITLEDVTDPATGQIVGERGRSIVETRIQQNPDWLRSDEAVAMSWERLRNAEADVAIRADELHAVGIQARLISGLMQMLEQGDY